MDAIRNQRLLLASTDPISPVRAALAEALRRALKEVHVEHEKAYSDGISCLAASPLWERIAAADRNRILADVGLAAPIPVDVSSDTLLLEALTKKSLSERRSDAMAVSGRVQMALEHAARLLIPKVRPLSIERATLNSPDDVHLWLDRQKKTLLDAVKVGPVLVN